MPKNEPRKKKTKVKLPDLSPKKDAVGGRFGYSEKPPLSIPPPGFMSSSKAATPSH